MILLFRSDLWERELGQQWNLLLAYWKSPELVWLLFLFIIFNDIIIIRLAIIRDRQAMILALPHLQQSLVPYFINSLPQFPPSDSTSLIFVYSITFSFVLMPIVAVQLEILIAFVSISIPVVSFFLSKPTAFAFP